MEWDFIIFSIEAIFLCGTMCDTNENERPFWICTHNHILPIQFWCNFKLFIYRQRLFLLSSSCNSFFFGLNRDCLFMGTLHVFNFNVNNRSERNRKGKTEKKSTRLCARPLLDKNSFNNNMYVRIKVIFFTCSTVSPILWDFLLSVFFFSRAQTAGKTLHRKKEKSLIFHQQQKQQQQQRSVWWCSQTAIAIWQILKV